ncbi:SH3 domain-containing protein [Streptomyces sp. NPDC004561]
MSVRSSLGRAVAVVAVTGALVGGVAAGPAAAGDGGRKAGAHFSTGVVTIRGGMWLRDRPGRGRRVRFVRRGQLVEIFCRARGEFVGGNPFWYLLADGTWAWGPARFIRVLGPAPRWC